MYRQDEDAHKLIGIKRLYERGERYLTRWFFQCLYFCVYVHRIHSADPDRHMHNHPRRFRCFILSGGYTEVVSTATRRYAVRRSYRAGDVNVLRPGEYHRIDSVLPNTWTLVLGGRRFRRWGFLVRGRHVDADTYLS